MVDSSPSIDPSPKHPSLPCLGSKRLSTLYSLVLQPGSTMENPPFPEAPSFSTSSVLPPNPCLRLALKVDLMKAFDMVDLGFLLETLAAFHFPPKVIMWIKACLTTPKFSISINGELAGFFSEKRGLHQGDPMSPYLFVIAREVLSKILAKRIEDSPSFKFH
ncbi:hypothetical protein Dsin_018798 [Dipteronia sinensis]|uniref:Reverse transcriptase domain-containing protein n=1 Tax=Dipteronia sinensis TaxID=43782 RepID=A0AAE0A5Z2_9ROSI|nr:hypothetical protein Dsin_018798 [Dipteronia sinensis]